MVQTAAAVGQHEKAALYLERGVGRLAHPTRDDPRFGQLHLIQHEKHVHPFRQIDDPVRQLALKVVRRRRPVLGVEAVQLAGRPAGLDHERLAVDRRDSRGRRDEMLEAHAGLGFERPAQLVALAVVAAKADGMDLADPEGDQVVEDRAGCTRLAPDLHDVVNRQAGFDRRLGFRGVDMQVPVEKEVAHDADAQLGIAIGDGVKTFGVHVPLNRR